MNCRYFLRYCPGIFVCFHALLVYGQQDRFVRGRLNDAKDNQAIPFATVRLEGRALGVVSNADGSFQIPLKFREMGEMLRISSMGYESLRIPIDQLETEGVNRISMNPSAIQLTEAILEASRIKRRSARNIVRTAIHRIPKNYPVNPIGLIGYYRDYQIKGGNYVNLNEAILEVIDQGFLSNDLEETRVRIYDYRPNSSFEEDSLAARPYDYQEYRKVISNAYLYNYGGNEFTILRMHDAIRNYRINTFSFAEVLARDFLRNHSFKREPDTYLDELPYYTIKLRTRKGFFRAEGKLLISRQDFSVHRFNYSLFDGLIEHPNGLKAYAGDDAGRLLFEVRTEYQRHGSSLYLNYISFRNSFRLRIPPVFKVDSVSAHLDCGCFKVYFNKPPLQETALDLKNYQADLGGKRVLFREANMHGNAVVLIPAKQYRPLFKNLTKFSGEQVGSDLVSLEIREVQDTDGNVVNIPEIRDLFQFREFFTQEILANPVFKEHLLYMYKERPIFMNQPISRPDNFGDYWMNTPLQESEF